MNTAGWFYDSVARHPDRIALVEPESEVSYARLCELVEGLRLAVGETGATRVGVGAHRGRIAYAGILATLAERAAFVPLNAKFPPARNRFILRKAGIDTIVLSADWLEGLSALLEADADLRLNAIVCEAPASFAEIRARYPDRIRWIQAEPSAERRPVRRPVAGELAYLMFTSGSTGQPKGVRVTHANLRGYVENFLRCYPLAPESRLSQTFDLTFDLSVHDQFVCWKLGAALVPFPSEVMNSPLAYAREKQVSVWFSVPSLVAYLAGSRQAEENALPALRHSFFCGEKLFLSTIETWRKIAPASRNVNLYGPTETTIAVSHFAVNDDVSAEDTHNGCVPLGRLFPAQQYEIRGPGGDRCAPGATGLLWLSGEQVTAGYEDEPRLTAERFVDRDGVVWYNTGDLVFEDGQGLIQYVGRDDFQVKIMGYRIELGEIEHALMRVSAAPEVAVDVWAPDGLEEIFAVLPAEFAPQKKRIREELRELLPAYMLPRRYFFLNEIPHNANGKIDRRRIKDELTRDREGAS